MVFSAGGADASATLALKVSAKDLVELRDFAERRLSVGYLHKPATTTAQGWAPTFFINA